MAFTDTNELNANVAEIIGTGYAVYKDSQYTLASPFSISQAAKVTIPNNALDFVKEDQLPVGVSTLYDASTLKLIPANLDDYYITTMRFKAKNSKATGYFETSIDIGGTFNDIFQETQVFTRGADKEQLFNVVIPYYTGGTFVANGGIPKINAIDGITSIYDIEYHIARISKGR